MTCYNALYSHRTLHIGMLLVGRCRLVEEDAVEVFHSYGFSLVLFFLDVQFQVLSGKNNNGVVFPFPFHIFMPRPVYYYLK
jgi:hypothetical protein